MDTMQAFIMGELNRGKVMMVFDWNKAAKLIKENKPECAIAGLRSDMEYTSGEIYLDGKVVPQEDTYTYLASTWATPILVLDGEEYECYIMADTTDWHEKTYWPESALSTLNDNS